jgi:hypothetical protein
VLLFVLLPTSVCLLVRRNGRNVGARLSGLAGDSVAFRMSPTNMDGPWRDANIIPRYNAAGLRKFVFHMPEGMPMIGEPPANEGPGTISDRLLRQAPGRARLVGRGVGSCGFSAARSIPGGGNAGSRLASGLATAHPHQDADRHHPNDEGKE